MMNGNPAAADDGLAALDAIDVEARYAINGAAFQRMRVHKISSSRLRILTRERLRLRSVISIEITSDAVHSGCLLGQITKLAGNEGGLLDYEITVLGDNTLAKALHSNVKRTAVERRPATRVEVDLKATYTLDGRSYETRVHQISASGFRIVSGHELAITSLITVDIVFDLNARVRLAGQVMRLAGRRNGLFDYGLKVVADSAVKNSLRAVVLKLQLKDNSKNAIPGFEPLRRA
jgi:hypothetical protein